MPHSRAHALADLIVRNLKGYALVVLAPDGTIRDWLGDATAMTGFPPKEAIGRGIDILFTDSDRSAGVVAAEMAVALREGRAEDSRWHRRKSGQLFWANGLTVRLDGDEPVLVKVFRDETPAKQAEEQRVLLLHELNHRVKNTLATVQSVVEQTLRSAGVAEDVRADLSNRMMALARAHNVLVEQSWAGADLEVLLRDIAQPYERDPSPFSFSGPAVRLHPSQAVTLALALHELATNAVKYGSLSVAGGAVNVSWNLAHNGGGERFLTLLWKESGGPPVQEPTRSGFGSRMIRQTFGTGQGARAQHWFYPAGVECAMALRLVDAERLNLEVSGTPADMADAAGPPGSARQ